MCSGPRRGHRCPRAGRDRCAGSRRRTSPRDRLREEGSRSQQAARHGTAQWAPRLAPIKRQPRRSCTFRSPQNPAPDFTGMTSPRAAAKTTHPRPPWAHQPRPGELGTSLPAPSSCQVPRGGATGPGPPAHRSCQVSCPAASHAHVTLCDPQWGGGGVPGVGVGLRSRQVGPIQPGPQRHCPWTGSQDAPLKQEQVWLQLCP